MHDAPSVEPGSRPAPLPAAVPTPRWAGLDALRGLSILAMILVNNPGRWGKAYQYAPLRHAEWHGCTFTDLVFPTFLFCAGVAIVPAVTKRLATGVSPLVLTAGIGRRVLWLVLLGMSLSAFPFVSLAADEALFAPLLRTRFPGVLQRIGVCYGIAALLFAFTRVRTWRWVLWGSLLCYWPLITLVPVPGHGSPDLGDPMATLQGFVDRAVFGDHIWVKGQYDPEGLLSTIPAVATCLFGVEAGRTLLAVREPLARIATLLRVGVVLMALGAVFGWFLPMNKYLWTSSFAVWTAGIATAGLGLCEWAFTAARAAPWLRPLQVYGTNALLVFVGSAILGRTIASLVKVANGDTRVSLKEWIFREVLLPIGDPMLASFAFALLWVLGWYAVLAWLFRRGIVWRV